MRGRTDAPALRRHHRFPDLALLPGLTAPSSWSPSPSTCCAAPASTTCPFAIGCMVFVCRRFALLFDRTEQLAWELDARVAERTKELTAETDAHKSMMLNIFHDLRSPLFAVSNGLETLESAPEALPALLPALRQRVEFLRQLTEDLFLAAKAFEQKQLLLTRPRCAQRRSRRRLCSLSERGRPKEALRSASRRHSPYPSGATAIRLQQIIPEPS